MSAREGSSSLAAERSVLAALLNSGAAAWKTLPSALKAEHFADEFHRFLFSVITDEIKAGRPARPAMLLEKLPAGAGPALHALIDSAVTTDPFADASALLDHAGRAALARIADGLKDAVDPAHGYKFDDVADDTRFQLDAIQREFRVGPAVVFKSLGDFCREYEPLSYTVEPIIRSGSLYSLTAKTGHGKTGFLVTAAFAIAAGARSVLDREVERGAVAYVALENPDDIRMRLIVAADRFGLSTDALSEQILILDRREPPEDVCKALVEIDRDFGLVVMDTFAAMFDGKDTNEAVQTGEFMRRLRPLTRLPGRPAVIVACHPVKNATADNLLPYGSGAILNEVDGNLTLWKNGDITILHWQGKLRGLEFDPMPFKFEPWESPIVLDTKGGRVRMPVCLPSSEEAVQERNRASAARDLRVLTVISKAPKETRREWASTTNISTGSVDRALKSLQKQKLIDKGIGERWRLTSKGKKELSDAN